MMPPFHGLSHLSLWDPRIPGTGMRAYRLKGDLTWWEPSVSTWGDPSRKTSTLECADEAPTAISWEAPPSARAETELSQAKKNKHPHSTPPSLPAQQSCPLSPFKYRNPTLIRQRYGCPPGPSAGPSALPRLSHCSLPRWVARDLPRPPSSPPTLFRLSLTLGDSRVKA